MPRRIRRLLIQIGSFVLAGLLLYLALRGVDFALVVDALREANYAWLGPLTVIVLLSHWLRAWRWQMLLEALPTSDRRVPVVEAFGSLIIGYMVNYAAPRLGEVARSANLSTRRRLPFSGVFGTVVVERILDAATLGACLISVIFLLRSRLGDLRRVFVEPLETEGSLLPLILAIVAVATIGTLLLVLARGYLRRNQRASDFWNLKVRPAAASFKAGLLTLFRSRRRVALVVSTVLIWSCYLFMAHLPFVMLGMAETYELSLADSWSIMLLGSLGFVIPSPGGTGSYHYITVLVLTSFFAFDRAPAATYAVLTHAAQLLLFVIAGFISIIIQGATLRSIKEQAETAEETIAEAGLTPD